MVLAPRRRYSKEQRGQEVGELDHNMLQRLRQVSVRNCPPLARIGDFLDEKLPSYDRHLVELHLQACPSCLNRLIELRELAILQKQGEAVPKAITRRVRELGGR